MYSQYVHMYMTQPMSWHAAATDSCTYWLCDILCVPLSQCSVYTTTGFQLLRDWIRAAQPICT